MTNISPGTKVAMSLDLELATAAVLVTRRSGTSSSQRVPVVLYLPQFTTTLLQPEHGAATVYTVLQVKVWFLKRTHPPTHKLSSLADRRALYPAVVP